MAVFWGRRDTWTVITGVFSRHRRDRFGRCVACRSRQCGYRERAGAYLSLVDPTLLDRPVLRRPPVASGEPEPFGEVE